ncbi:MAG: LysM peptidoglycan-binding domain-containing protein [Phycisphaerae bacterium]
MAQETKVGLLAGLAFIVCFAVILTNRGNERFSNEDLGVRADSRPAHSAPPAQTTPEANGSNPGTGWRRHATADDAIPPVDAPTATRPAAGGRPERNEQFTEDRPARTNMDPAWTSASRAELERRLDELAAQVERQHLAQATSALPGRAAEQNRPGPPPEPAVLSARSAKERANRPGMAYTVASGDSLSKIARLFYGSGSRTVINAIFDANRAVLPSVDKLRAGLNITLPPVAGFDGPRSAGAHRVPASPAAGQDIHRQERSEPGDTPWYEIQKNDRYAKIAREQLGDESRWREIFELNKDKFPKPDMIRPGVRIRLPGRRVASAGGARR